MTTGGEISSLDEKETVNPQSGTVSVHDDIQVKKLPMKVQVNTRS